MNSSTIPQAGSVLLARASGSQEVYLVRRADNLRFFGGFDAFPGGRVDEADIALARDFPSLSAAHVTAIRELFEETGVLLARTTDGSFPTGVVEPLRRDLLHGQLSFRILLFERGWSLHADDLIPAGELVTPPFSPIRFATRFFVATLPPGQEPAVWPGELSGGQWLRAEDALGAWARAERLVSPPTVMLLEAIRGRPVADLAERLPPLLERLAAGAFPPIAFAPDVDLLPLRCESLLPGTHTNAYLVGRDPAYLLDPGSDDPREQARLFDALDRHLSVGRRLAAVVLTHHHPDHVGAATACAERYGVPILAHAGTARLLAGKIAVTGQLGDGDRLPLGATSEGTPAHLEAIFTPGHAPGHLCFFHSQARFLFAGDMVSTLSSVVIAPPEGDLAVYLDSLCRLQRYPARLLLPAHGAPTARVANVLEDYLSHRRAREEQLLAALSLAPRSAAALAQELYRGLPKPLSRLAELQTLAGLIKLEREGLAANDGDAGWRRASVSHDQTACDGGESR